MTMVRIVHQVEEFNVAAVPSYGMRDLLKNTYTNLNRVSTIDKADILNSWSHIVISRLFIKVEWRKSVETGGPFSKKSQCE